jgi:hypothetical protein
MHGGVAPAPPSADVGSAQMLIIMSAGRLTMETFDDQQTAVAALRRWYFELLDDHPLPERVDLVTEFGAPATATVAQMNAFFGCWDDPADYWCDIVPVEAVLNRIAPPLIRHAEQAHAAVVLADGLVAAQPCASYATALAALRTQASAWEHDDTVLNTATASIEDLSAVYCDEHAGQWLGIMPILLTENGPAVLVPLDYLPATI